MTRKRLAGFRLDEELLAALKRVQERDGIPQSEMVRRAVRAYLEARGEVSVKTDRKRVGARRRS